MALPSDSPPPVGDEPFVMVDESAKVRAAAQQDEDDREELEHLYSLFAPAPSSSSSGQERARWEDAAWAAQVRARRQEMGGQLFFDRLLQLAGITDESIYPPTSQPALHALLDKIHQAPGFDKAKKDSLVFYLLLALYPVDGFPAPRSSSAGASLAELKDARMASRAWQFASLELLPASLARPIRAYFLLDSGRFVEATSFIDESEIEPAYVRSVLEMLLRIPADFSSEVGWAHGAYKARAIFRTVQALRLDLLAQWQTLVQEAAVGTQEDAYADLQACEAQLVGYAEALAFERGVWVAWESLVEALPAIGEQILEALELDLENEGQARAADQIYARTNEVRERIARVLWDYCFHPAPKPAAVKQMLALPLSPASWDLLNKLVLSPSRSLSLPLQATAADVLLVRYIDEGRYVDALRLDALLDTSFVGSASAGMADADRRAVLVEKRKRLLQGVQALVPAVQKKLLDLELGFIKEDDSRSTPDESPSSAKEPLQMSWENVGGASVPSPAPSFAKGTPIKGSVSRPLSASPLLRQSPHNGSDPQKAVLDAVVRGSVSPSQKPSEAFRRRPRPSGDRDVSADKHLAGFLARNRSAETPTRSLPSTLQDTSADVSGSALHSASPFVAPPNLASLPAPMFTNEAPPSRDGQNGSPAGSIFSGAPTLFAAPVRRYEARFTDPGASSPAAAPRSPGLLGTPHYRERLGLGRGDNSFGTDNSMMEDEIIPIAPSKSRTTVPQKETPEQKEQAKQPAKQPSPEPRSPPQRRRFGLPARATRDKEERPPQAASQPRQDADAEMEVDDAADDPANTTIPGGFPGLADRAAEMDAAQEQGEGPKRKSSRAEKQPEQTSPAKSARKSLRPSRSTMAIAASTPRRRTRQQTAELESQAGSDGEGDDDGHTAPPVSSTPVGGPQRRTRNTRKTKDAELESLSEATQDEDAEEEGQDGVGELVSPTKRPTKGRASSSRASAKASGTPARRKSTRAGSASVERDAEEIDAHAEDDDAAKVTRQSPQRRATRAKARKA